MAFGTEWLILAKPTLEEEDKRQIHMKRLLHNAERAALDNRQDIVHGGFGRMAHYAQRRHSAARWVSGAYFVFTEKGRPRQHPARVVQDHVGSSQCPVPSAYPLVCRGCPSIATKCRSTLPVRSMPPMATSQTKKATPMMGCMMVAASNQISCIAMPITADTGEMRLRVPPTFHWRSAATTSPSPATAKPILPVSHRR